MKDRPCCLFVSHFTNQKYIVKLKIPGNACTIVNWCHEIQLTEKYLAMHVL